MPGWSLECECQGIKNCKVLKSIIFFSVTRNIWYSSSLERAYNLLVKKNIDAQILTISLIFLTKRSLIFLRNASRVFLQIRNTTGAFKTAQFTWMKWSYSDLQYLKSKVAQNLHGTTIKWIMIPLVCQCLDYKFLFVFFNALQFEKKFKNPDSIIKVVLCSQSITINMHLATLYLSFLDKCFHDDNFIPVQVWSVFNEHLFSRLYSFISMHLLSLRRNTSEETWIQFKNIELLLPSGYCEEYTDKYFCSYRNVVPVEESQTLNSK